MLHCKMDRIAGLILIADLGEEAIVIDWPPLFLCRLDLMTALQNIFSHAPLMSP